MSSKDKNLSVEEMMARLRSRFEQAAVVNTKATFPNASKRPGALNQARVSRKPSLKKSPMSSHAQARLVKQQSILRDDDLLREVEGDLVSGSWDDFDSVSLPSSPMDAKGPSDVHQRKFQSHQQHQQQQMQHQYQAHVQNLLVQFEMEKKTWAARMQQLQMDWEADKKRMAPLDKEFSEFQAKARREKVDAQIQIDDLKKELQSVKSAFSQLQVDKDNFQNVLNGKDEEFRKMKVMVDNQMNEMRAHFLGLQQELQKVLKLKESLSARVETSESQLKDLKRQLQMKAAEVQECQQKANMYAEKCNLAEAKVVEMQSNSMGATTEANQQINELQSKLSHVVNQHQNLLMLHENLKSTFVQTKIELSNHERRVEDLTKQLNQSQAEKKELILMTEALLEGTENFSE